MKFSSLLTCSALAAVGLAQRDDPLEKHTIKADGIEASFIGYGARLTNCIVKDKHGKKQDVILGYDTGKEYVNDTLGEHTYFGAVVGRYANRIKNGTFELNGHKSKIPTNENDGADTLHGGDVGYDQRNWTVTSANDSTVTFTLVDTGFEGFPGTVITHATYSVKGSDETDSGKPTLFTRLVSTAVDEATPIMLSTHLYWNLGAFTDNGSIVQDTLHMPNADRYVETDTILVPNGTIGSTVHGQNGILDFTKAKKIGKDIHKAKGLCGLGCTGYDNAFIFDRPVSSARRDEVSPQLSLSNPNTGIKLEMRTNQQGVQLYSCANMAGAIAVKKSQQHGNSTTMVDQYNCLVIEPQDWVDGINHPEWGRQGYQVYSPETGPAVNFATYEFSTV